MSTQNRNSGGGGTARNQKKSNANSSGIGGTETNAHAATNHKKSDVTKTEKEKVQPKPTPEQLRIAQITNSNAAEDPQMQEKVATLIEMTQRSEEEVCCALYECDNNMELAVVFLFETLPVGAFETSSKKKKKQAAAVSGQDGTGVISDGNDGWNDGPIHSSSDKHEKSRNRSSNRGGRGGTDSRGWRGREARENERNLRESRSSGFGGGYNSGERGDREDRANREDRGPRGSGMSRRSGEGGSGGSGGGLGGNGRGGGYAGRTGRGGGRMGGRMSGLGRSDRSSGGGIGGGGGGGGYNNSRQSTSNDEHHEVELWDNTIAQNAEKQNHMQDDAWGDWDNEEYVGSLKDSKVFTTSNLPNQTTASVVSGGLQVVGGPLNDGLSAPPGLESHLGGVPLSPNAGVNDDAITPLPTTPMQYSAALTGGTSVQQQAVQTQQAAAAAAATASSSGLNVNAPQYNSVIADTFTNAANAAANLVQQVQAQQQAQTQLKAAASATLSAEQSQYFNSLTSQNAAAAAAAAGGVVVSSPGGVVVAPQQQQQTQQPQSPLTPQIATYAQSAATAVATGVQYPTTYANVFATTAAGANGNNSNTTPVGLDQQQPMQQVRRPRTKLPPPSKIPSTAVEMPGDSMNNMGYIDVQFGGLDFGTEDSFDVLTDKFNTSVTIDNQGQQVQQQPTQQQQQQQLVQDVNSNDYNQSKGGVVAQQTSQTSLNAGLQNPQITDSLNAGYAGQRGAAIPAPQQQQQQQQVVGNNVGNVGASTLDHLSKNEHVYNQSNVNNSGGYQSPYQTNATIKVANNAYQQSTAAQAYNTNAYGNVQASVGNSYQAQAYGSYQHNAVNSYQQQAANSVPGAVNNGTVNNNNSSQNIPVGGSNSNNATANTNSGYLSTGYPTQQNAYQASQSVYGSTGLSNSSGVTTNNNNNSNNNVSGVAVNAATGPNANSVGVSSNNANNNGSTGSTGSSQSNSNANSVSNANASNANNSVSSAAVSSAVSAVVANKNSGGGVSAVTGATSSGAATAAGAGAAAGGSGGMVPNIQMVSQYIQASLPYYQQPVYSYEELPMMQQRVPHVQGYYDLNYTPTSLGAGRDNLGSVAYSTMTDGRFARTDNNSSPVSNQVSSTMSQQAGSSGPMLNVPYYFYGGNMVPGSFQYGTPAIYSQQIPAPNTASGGQFAKPSYNTGYGSTSYDALSQASQDYSKGGYPSSVNPTNKPQNVSNQPPAGTGTDIASSMYGKGHVALNKVNSYEKQNFHSGTPPPFNMPNTQTAGGTSAQPYGMYLPMPATAPHHTNIMHQPIHQDSNSTGQRQQTNSQSKSANKQGYSPNYWAGQN